MAALLACGSSLFADKLPENLLSLSLGDLYAVARGNGRVDTPERIEGAIALWSKLYNCNMVLWRVDTMHLDHFEMCKVGYIAKHRQKMIEMRKKFDHHAAGREASHKNGVKFLLNLSFNDGGWPQVVDGCKVMYAYQDKVLIAHPEYQEVDKRGVYHYGYLDLSNPDARKFMVERLAKYIHRIYTQKNIDVKRNTLAPFAEIKKGVVNNLRNNLPPMMKTLLEAEIAAEEAQKKEELSERSSGGKTAM